MSNETLTKSLKNIIEHKYKDSPNEFRQSLTEKVLKKVKERLSQGKKLSIHIYDKSAKSQNISYMKREPIFFNILNIDN